MDHYAFQAYAQQNGQGSDAAFNAWMIARTFWPLNVAANPLVYCLVSARFRHECRALLGDCWTNVWP